MDPFFFTAGDTEVQVIMYTIQSRIQKEGYGDIAVRNRLKMFTKLTAKLLNLQDSFRQVKQDLKKIYITHQIMLQQIHKDGQASLVKEQNKILDARIKHEELAMIQYAKNRRKQFRENSTAICNSLLMAPTATHDISNVSLGQLMSLPNPALPATTNPAPALPAPSNVVHPALPAPQNNQPSSTVGSISCIPALGYNPPVVPVVAQSEIAKIEQLLDSLSVESKSHSKKGKATGRNIDITVFGGDEADEVNGDEDDIEIDDAESKSST